MKQFVFVINGAGGVGKDTLCNMLSKHYRVQNISSITPIKNIATICGWGGEKNDHARKFLADLKSVTVAYNDYPTKWILEEYRKFKESEDEILFVHIREGSEIRKFVDGTNGEAITILVRGGHRFRRRNAVYGNAADDDVEKYRYDYVFYNDRPLAQTESAFLAFVDKIRQERA